MRQSGRVRSSERFIVLAVVTLAVLLSVLACDLGQDGVETHEIVIEQPVHKHPPLESSEPSRLAPTRLAPCVPATPPDSRRPNRMVAWGPEGSEILYSFGSGVYAASTDGLLLRIVVNGSPVPEGRTSFDISPDGANIVYSTCKSRGNSSEADGDARYTYEYELALVNRDGTERQVLIRRRSFKDNPAWSPDGTRVAFLSESWQSDSGRVVSLNSMAADRTGQRVEARGSITLRVQPQWSPDGERIAFVKDEDDGARAIYVVMADGSLDEWRLTDTVSGPSWSPDGTWIAFAKADGDDVALYTIAADGMDEQRLTVIDGWQPVSEEADPAKAWITKVAWSPAGEQILYTCGEAGGNVCVVGVGGTPVDRLPIGFGDGALPAWSPDGSRIAVVTAGGVNHDGVFLYTAAPDGSDLLILSGQRRKDAGMESVGGQHDVSTKDVAACAEGFVVPDPETNAGLVEDCKTLLEIRDELRGMAWLHWGSNRPIADWVGVAIGGTPPRVREIDLRSRRLRGTIPRGLSRLSELRTLNLSGNYLGDEIPWDLGMLENLRGLDVRDNYLTGEIPPELGRLTELVYLLLDDNYLQGPIPPELGALAKLQSLAIHDNLLTGMIPAELGKLANLKGLRLQGNRLTGTIPPELGNLSDLISLDFSGNKLTGAIPAELGQLASLKVLTLDDNRLTGAIPPELGDLPKLRQLDLTENQFAGCVPVVLRDIRDTDIGDLDLPDCE